MGWRRSGGCAAVVHSARLVVGGAARCHGQRPAVVSALRQTAGDAVAGGAHHSGFGSLPKRAGPGCPAANTSTPLCRVPSLLLLHIAGLHSASLELAFTPGDAATAPSCCRRDGGEGPHVRARQSMAPLPQAPAIVQRGRACCRCCGAATVCAGVSSRMPAGLLRPLLPLCSLPRPYPTFACVRADTLSSCVAYAAQRSH